MFRKRPQSQTISFLLALATVFCFLMLWFFTKSNAEKNQITVFITTDQVCTSSNKDPHKPLGNVKIQLNNQTYTTVQYEVLASVNTGEITPGNYELRASSPDFPSAKLAYVLYNDAADSEPVTYKPNSSGTVNLNFRLGGLLEVYLDTCAEEQKEILVTLLSDQCKSPPKWDGLTLFFGADALGGDFNEDAEDVMGNGIMIRKRFKISPDPYDLRVHSSYFPKAAIQEVALYKSFETERPVFDRLLKSKVKKITYTKPVNVFDVNDNGTATVPLDKSLWEDKGSRFRDVGLTINVVGNCEDPETEPKEFGIVTVKYATPGEVQVLADHRSVKLLLMEPVSEAKKGDKYRGGVTIMTSNKGVIELETEYKHRIFILGNTNVDLEDLMTESGRRELQAVMKRGQLLIERRSSDTKDGSSRISVQTGTALVTSPKTSYTVSYDETTKLTTVGVKEGEVEVFPENEALEAVTLGANQQVQVSDKSISKVSSYSGELGSRTSPILLVVGIGAAALVGLLIVVAGITFLYRRAHRAPVQPAFQQSSIKVEATPANLATPQHLGSLAAPTLATTVATNVATNEWRCPNPQCGKLVPSNKKFCTACGSTQSGVRVGAPAVNIAPPAVATSERRCPNPQCGKLVPAPKKFCTACGTPVI